MQCEDHKLCFVNLAQQSEIERVNYLKMQSLREKQEIGAWRGQRQRRYSSSY